MYEYVFSCVCCCSYYTYYVLTCIIYIYILSFVEGTTLRNYLSKVLNCDPMRITKKYTGNSSTPLSIKNEENMLSIEYVIYLQLNYHHLHYHHMIIIIIICYHHMIIIIIM